MLLPNERSEVSAELPTATDALRVMLFTLYLRSDCFASCHTTPLVLALPLCMRHMLQSQIIDSLRAWASCRSPSSNTIHQSHHAGHVHYTLSCNSTNCSIARAVRKRARPWPYVVPTMEMTSSDQKWPSCDLGHKTNNFLTIS